jgi:hypothetical protein
MFERFSRTSMVCVAGALALASCSRKVPRSKPAKVTAMQPTEPTKLGLASVEQRLPRVPKDLAWLVFGGGSDPLSNQISIAQDLELTSSLLAGRGMTLFASGAGAYVAIERADVREADDSELPNQLAKLLGPPSADRIRYEPATLAVDAPATRDHVLDALTSALESGTTPLLVFASGHGDRGSVPRENSIGLWGGWPLSVEEYVELLDSSEHTRPTRLVLTSCFGGGFAELAFVEGNPRKGPRSPEHCGLFAAPWDDESSGCDPNPDRRGQESYAIHFLNALRGTDRRGEDHLHDIDVDRDSRVSLREAHAWARIHSRSFDVPTSTSERYLREYARAYDSGRGPPELDLEELSVVRALSTELELEDERAARTKLQELERILLEVGRALEDAQQAADDNFYALRIALLERWPLLEHAWEPRTRALIEREGPRIEQLLSDSDLASSHALAARELEEAFAQHDAVRVSRARVLRLVRAYETLRLAGALKRSGGTRYAHYEALRSCERFVPEVRAPLRRAELARQPRISQAVEPEADAK